MCCSCHTTFGAKEMVYFPDTAVIILLRVCMVSIVAFCLFPQVVSVSSVVSLLGEQFDCFDHMDCFPHASDFFHVNICFWDEFWVVIGWAPSVSTFSQSFCIVECCVVVSYCYQFISFKDTSFFLRVLKFDLRTVCDFFIDSLNLWSVHIFLAFTKSPTWYGVTIECAVILWTYW